VRALLDGRAPVSTRCGARGEAGWLALINLAIWRPPGPELVSLPELEALVVCERRGRTLRLYDVVARVMPSLAAITARVGRGCDTVEVLFAPDALDAPELAPRPTPPGDVLMTRGPFAPTALSPLAHC